MSPIQTTIEKKLAESSANDAPGDREGGKKRGRYLLNWKKQIPGALVAALSALIFVVLLNISSELVLQRFTRSLLETLPDLESSFNNFNDSTAVWMRVASVFFVAGVFVVSILRSHRTVGPTYRICRDLAKIEAGDYSLKINLRKRDNLKEISGALNSTLASLQQRTRREITTLEGLAIAARELQPADKAHEVTAALQGMMDSKKKSIGEAGDE